MKSQYALALSLLAFSSIAWADVPNTQAGNAVAQAAPIPPTVPSAPASKDGDADGYVEPFERSSSDLRMSASAFQSTMPAPVAEALSILAEIAVSRAKRQGLTLLHDKLEHEICKLKTTGHDLRLASPGDKSVAILPNTCQLVKNTTLEKLASDPSVLVAAVTQDLIDAAWLVPQTAGGLSSDDLATVLQVATGVALRALTRPTPVFTTQDAWIIGSVILNRWYLNKKSDPASSAVVCGLGVVRTCLAGNPPCDVVREIATAKCTTNEPDFLVAVNVATEAYTMVYAETKSSFNSETTPNARERLRAAVRLLGLIADHTVTDKGVARRIVVATQLMEAAIDGSQARMISLGAGLIAELITETDAVELRRVARILAALSAYAATFSLDPSKTPTADQLASLRQSRKAILEDLIDANTDRTERQGDWVVSIGAPVGFQARLAETSNDRAGYDPRHYRFRAPQLALPMGIAVQNLPGTRGKPATWGIGLHAMLSLLDIGQLLGYRSDGSALTPTWDTVVSPGLQVAAAIGQASNLFLLGLDLRYARDLQAAESNGHLPRALQVGVFAAYYVSFFDVN